MVTDKSGRHLNAAVRYHAIEPGFVARTLVSKAFVEPETCLDSPVCSCKVIAVLFKDIPCRVRNGGHIFELYCSSMNTIILKAMLPKPKGIICLIIS